MLSVWPNLFDFQLAAPFVLRLAAAIALAWLSYDLGKSETLKQKPLGLVLGLGSLLLAIGLWVQPTALVLFLITDAFLIHKPAGATPQHRLFYLLLAAILLSLLVLGPGFFAFDRPL